MSPSRKQRRRHVKASSVNSRTARGERRRRRLQLESLENRLLLTTTLYIDYGDRFPGGVLNTNVGALNSTTSGSNPNINGPTLQDAANNPYAAATTVSIQNFNAIYGTNAATARATIDTLVTRFFQPLDVLVVDLTANFQTVGGSRVRAAASLAEISQTLGLNEPGSANSATENNDAYIIVGRFWVNGNDNPTFRYGGLAPVDVSNASDDTGLVLLNDNVEALALQTATFVGTQVAHEASHTLGLSHSFGDRLGGVPTPGSGINTGLLQSDIQSYLAYDTFGGFNFFTRYPLPRGGPFTGPANSNNNLAAAAIPPATATQPTQFDQLVNTANIGPSPVYEYVTGTGQNDIIAIQKTGANSAIVRVQAFSNTNYPITSAITVPVVGGTVGSTYSYTIPLSKSILVEGGARNDRIIIDGDLGVPVTVRGMHGTDELIILGRGAASATYTPSPFTAAGLDGNADLRGTITVGGTTIDFSEFEAASSLNIQNVGTVTVEGTDGVDRLRTRHDGDDQRITGTVNGTSTSAAIAMVPLTLSNVDAVNINTRDDRDRITVEELRNGMSLAIDGGAGNDDVIIGGRDFDTNIEGPVSVEDLVGFNTLRIDNQDDAFADQTYTLDRDASGTPRFQISTISTSPVTFLGMDSVTINGCNEDNETYDIYDFGTLNGGTLTINGRGGIDTFNVFDTRADLELNGGRDTDTFNIGDGTYLRLQDDGGVGGIVGDVTVNGGTGDDTLVIDDSANEALRSKYLFNTGTADLNDVEGYFDATITPLRLPIPLDAGRLTFEVVEEIELKGRVTFLTQYYVTAVSPGTSLTLNGSAAPERFIISDRDQDEDGEPDEDGDYDARIRSDVVIHAGAGNDELIIADQTDTGDDTYTLRRATVDERSGGEFTKESVGVPDVPTVGFTSIASVKIEGSDRAKSVNTFNIEGTRINVAVTVNGNGGVNAFNIGQKDFDSNIAGAVTVNGGDGVDILNIDDSESLTGSRDFFEVKDRYTLTSDTFQKTVFTTFGGQELTPRESPTLTFDSIADFRLQGSNSNGSPLAPGGRPESLFNIHGVAEGTSLTIHGNSGDDEFVVLGASNDYLDSEPEDLIGDYDTYIDGPLILHGDTGDDALEIDDRGDTRDDTYILRRATFDEGDGGEFTKVSDLGSNAPTLGFTSVVSVKIDGSDADNTFSLEGSRSGVAVTVNGHGGADTFVVTAPPLASISITGGSPTASPGDTLTVVGTPTSVATYTAGSRGAGEIAIDGQTISFTRIEEPLAANGFLQLTLAVPSRLNDLWVRDDGNGYTSISDRSDPADGPGVLRFINVGSFVLDGTTARSTFFTFDVVLEPGSLNGQGLSEFTIVSGLLQTFVRDRILQGPPSDALLRIRRGSALVNHDISGSAERLEIELHDHVGETLGQFTTARAYDTAGNIVHRFEDERVGTVGFLDPQPDVQVILDGTIASLSNSETLGKRIRGNSLSTLELSPTSDGRLRVRTVGDMTVNILDTLFPNFQFDPIFRLDTSPIGTFHVRPVTTTADDQDGSLRVAVQRANAKTPGGTSVVFFDLRDTDPGYVDIDSHLPDGDDGRDAFVIQPRSVLPVLTRGNTIINGDSQQLLTGDTNPFGPEIILDGSQVLVGTDNPDNSPSIDGLVIASDNNRIHGLGITEFAGNGVTVASGTGNTIRRNSIHSNGGLGIDLGGDGVTVNDGLDLDDGPNDLQNIPVIGLAQSGTTTRVAGNLVSTPSSTFTLDFYASTIADFRGGSWEGRRWLGSGIVTTDANGHASYDIILNAKTDSGETITATVTNANGSTSEFSQGISDDVPANTFVVTNTNDSGLGSLRDAIVAANQIAGEEPVQIWFRLPTTDPGFVDVDSHLPGGDTLPDVYVISPQLALPALTRGNIVIDGESQFKVSGRGKNPFGPMIVLDGSLVAIAGLRLFSDDNTVHGLGIHSFGGNGVAIGGDGNTVTSSYIGIDPTGNVDLGNGGIGVFVRQVAGNLIEGNLISGNEVNGVVLAGSLATGNVVRGNKIGTNADGTAPIRNSFGIHIVDAPANVVEDNLISGNIVGIVVGQPNATGNVLQGNYIGTTADGMGRLGNLNDGIDINGAPGNTIDGNLISGNSGTGVSISGHASTGNLVVGNFIGTDVQGTAKLSNIDGVSIVLGAAGNRIGGTSVAERNVISGNSRFGVMLASSFSDPEQVNVVQGNYIGTDQTGMAALGNTTAGIAMVSDHHSVIGGTQPGAGNVISGNGPHGIWMYGGNGTTDVRVQGNLIGTNADGTAAVPNWRGISVYGHAHHVTHNIHIGGTDPAERNVISGNSILGVEVLGRNATSIVIQGNHIGTDVTGSYAVPNAGDGILLAEGAVGEGVGGAVIGGTEPGAGNLVSGNDGNGIHVTGTAPSTKTGPFDLAHVSALHGWSGYGNKSHRNSFGFSHTNHTGATPGSEAGGTFARSSTALGETGPTPIAYYADTRLGGTMTLDAPLHASGELNVTETDAFDGGVHLSFFNRSDAEANRLRNVVGLAVLEVNPREFVTGLRVKASMVLSNGALLYGTSENGTSINAPDGLDEDTRYTWEYDYDPQGGIHSQGRMTVEVFADGTSLGTNWIDLTAEQRAIGANLDAFGLYTGGSTPKSNNPNTVTLYVDDLTYTRAVGNLIQGNYIGTDATGHDDLGNGAGIVLLNSHHNQIGGSSPEARNVISGNTVHGIQLRAGSNDNTIQGNYIGTDATGTIALSNEIAGIDIIVDASRNIIGTDGDGQNDELEGNLISGNDGYGIQLRGLNLGTLADNVITGNFIGVNAGGNDALGNRGGILVWGTSNTRIGTNADGTSDLAERNIIAANGDPDVEVLNGIAGDWGIYMTQNEDTVIAGNYIGVGADGLNPLGNVADGIAFIDSPRTVVGGRVRAARNVIADNGRHGIAQSRSNDVLIAANYIGVGADGTTPRGNADIGVFIRDASNNTIGGTTLEARNVISDNDGNGISIIGDPATEFDDKEDFVAATGAVDATGPIPNLGAFGGTVMVGQLTFGPGPGSVLHVGATPNHADWYDLRPGHEIALSDAENLNVDLDAPAYSFGFEFVEPDATMPPWGGEPVESEFTATMLLGEVVVDSFSFSRPNDVVTFVGFSSAHEFDRVEIRETTGTIDDEYFGRFYVGTTPLLGNTIQGNYIGVAADGMSEVGNRSGIHIEDSAGNLIGGAEPGSRNVISSNGGDGVYLIGQQTSGNVVAGNYIGVGADGQTDLGNFTGVKLIGGSDNQIGGTAPGEGNVISGNFNGIEMQATVGTVVQGNFIGTDATGNFVVANFNTGVFMARDTDAIIGGTEAGSGNVISGNAVGIRVDSFATFPSQGVRILGNRIGTNADGTEILGNAYGVDATTVAAAPIQDLSIGGVAPGAGNLISGNSEAGIRVQGEQVRGLRIQGNKIGTDIDGVNARPNGTGVLIEEASGVLVGGAEDGAGNLISGNTGNGITIKGGSGHTIQGNYIGTNKGGDGGLLPGTVSWYRAEGNAEDAFGANHGTLVNGAAFAPGIVGQAFSFDGVDDVVTTPLVVDYTGGVTFEAWVRTTDSDGTVMSGDGGRTAGRGMGLFVHENQIAIGGTNETPGTPNFSIVRPVVADGEFHHVAATWTGDTTADGVKLYLDGALVGTATANSAVTTDSALLNIGGHTSIGYHKLAGLIDEPAVFSRVLSEAEIQFIYDQAAAGKTSDMGNAGDGVHIVNSSGNKIGGNTPEARNLISGNDGDGILISGMANPNANGLVDKDTFIAATGAQAVAPFEDIGFVHLSVYTTTDEQITLRQAAPMSPFTLSSGVTDRIEGPTVSVNDREDLDIDLSEPSYAFGFDFVEPEFDPNVNAGFVDSTFTVTLKLGSEVVSTFDFNAPNDQASFIGATSPQPFDRIEIRETVGGIENEFYGRMYIANTPAGNVVQGNYIGTTADGTGLLGNAGGIVVTNSANNLIGGTTPEARNVISGNEGTGVTIGVLGDTTSVGNRVLGNYIGTDVTGTLDLGNTSSGVFVLAPDNIIGTPGAGNVISGNEGIGVVMAGSTATGNVVQSNLIGTDETGTKRLGNSLMGVVATSAPGNLIGGPTEAHRNVISANLIGVAVNQPGADNNVIQGNWIGTDINGAAPLGNTRMGVLITWATGTTIEGNLISDNGESGIHLTAPSSQTVIRANVIGTDRTGTIDLGNKANAISIQDSPDNIVGGTEPGDGNLLSGNDLYGINIVGDVSTGNRVLGNFVGTNAAGDDAVPNGWGGILIASGAHDNTIGGREPGARNVISGNDGSAIAISGSTSTGNRVQGNYIGTDVSGSLNIGNGGWNVVVQGAPNNLIGGATPGSGNVVAGGTGYGVIIFGPTATGNTVQGNRIGTDAAGLVAFSNHIGLSIQDAGGNTVDDNIISGNAEYGVYVSGPTGTGNRFVNNSIGVGSDGTTAVPNGAAMYIAGSTNNTIGVPGEGNVIAHNARGVVIVGAAAAGNTVRGNSIHSNNILGIDLAGDNVTPNDDLDGDAGPNELQNFPELLAVRAGSTTKVHSTFNSTPNSTFILDFYASSDLDASGYGEGQRYLGSATVTTGATGEVILVNGEVVRNPRRFSVELDAETAGGEYISATATDATGNTSEFSGSFMASGRPSRDSVRLIIGGGPGSDNVLLSSGSVHVEINGVTFVFEDDGTSNVEAHLLAGNDTFISALANDTRAFGDSGDDFLQLGSGDDEAFGGPGNDTILLGPGNDKGDGGGGDDHVDGQGGSDEVATGDGNDTVVTDGDDDLGAFSLDVIAPISLTADSVVVRGQPLTVGGQYPDPASTTSWNFGDGGTAEGQQVTHVYTSAGSYRAELAITDPAGNVTRIARDLPVGVTAMQIDRQDPNLTALAVGGTTSDDHIVINKHGNKGEVKALLDGGSLGTFAPSGHLLVYGQAGDDNIQVAGSISLGAWLFGDAGDDRLNGGNGPNVLAGGIGDDFLIGGSKEDLLEGGQGADRLIGNGGDDILIGGFLAFAHQEAALAAIMAEWNSDRSYDERVANLRGDDTRPSFDQRANGEVFLSVAGPSPTVRDDGADDRVTGSAGRDWYFANLDEDLLTDERLAESVSEL